MNCKEARKRIYPLLDDELETETNIEVLGHLNVCDRCQEKFEAERDFLNELSDALSDREVPDDVREDIQKRLEEARNKQTGGSWFSGGGQWNNMMSAAVFLLVLVTAGVLSNYYPLHRVSPSEQVVRTFPAYHDKIVERNKERFQKLIKNGEFKSLPDIQKKLIERFPSFRDRLKIPSLKENKCKIIDAKSTPKTGNFNAPNFHVIYCYTGDWTERKQKHEGVMLMGLKQSDIALDRVSDLRSVSGSDGFYINPDDGRRTHCIFWKDETFLLAMVTDGLSRDHLIELARSARKEMTSGKSTSTSGSNGN